MILVAGRIEQVQKAGVRMTRRRSWRRDVDLVEEVEGCDRFALLVPVTNVEVIPPDDRGSSSTPRTWETKYSVRLGRGGWETKQQVNMPQTTCSPIPALFFVVGIDVVCEDVDSPVARLPNHYLLIHCSMSPKNFRYWPALRQVD